VNAFESLVRFVVEINAFFRWLYFPGNRSNLGPGELVIQNIPSAGHVTRTLIFGPDKFLYMRFS
jgi:glucose/arabinose dehydrogenase